jgi:hypothetical protein
MSSRKQLSKMTPEDQRRARSLRRRRDEENELLDGIDGRLDVREYQGRTQRLDRYLRELRIHHAYDPHAEHAPAVLPTEPPGSGCPQCNSSRVVRNGSWNNDTGRTQRFLCKDCNHHYAEKE